MDIFEYAMQIEKDGENFYRELAGRTDNKGVKNVLTMLADAEVVHYNIFGKMKDCAKVEPADSTILENVKNVFIRMRDGSDVAGLDVPQIELYRNALEIEKKSEDFYCEKAGEVKDDSQKKIFLKIAGEEKVHYFIVEKIMDFVSRPLIWLENAEWYHLEEY